MTETTNTTHQTEDRSLPEADADRCPICAEPFKPEDLCAEDISEGTCHAACLEGSPVVDLETGEELPDGEFDTYRFSEVMDEPDPTSSDRWTPWQGGEMPIAEGTAVEVILRYGKQALAQAGSGYASRWSYDGKYGDHDDIVFYRLACPTPSTHLRGYAVGMEHAAQIAEGYDQTETLTAPKAIASLIRAASMGANIEETCGTGQDDLTDCFRHHVTTTIGWLAFGARPGPEMQMYEEGFKAGYRRCQSDNEPELGEEDDAVALMRKTLEWIEDYALAFADLEEVAKRAGTALRAYPSPQTNAVAIVEALARLAEYGVPTDIQEALVHGSASYGIRLGALAAVLSAPEKAAPQMHVLLSFAGEARRLENANKELSTSEELRQFKAFVKETVPNLHWVLEPDPNPSGDPDRPEFNGYCDGWRHGFSDMSVGPASLTKVLDGMTAFVIRELRALATEGKP